MKPETENPNNGGMGMKATGIVRPLVMGARIVLPVELRRSLTLGAHTSIEYLIMDGAIALRKHQPACSAAQRRMSWNSTGSRSAAPVPGKWPAASVPGPAARRIIGGRPGGTKTQGCSQRGHAGAGPVSKRGSARPADKLRFSPAVKRGPAPRASGKFKYASSLPGWAVCL